MQQNSNSLNDVLKFSFKEKTFLIDLFKKILFNQLTANSFNLFLRGKDIISIGPQITGTHEPAITNLINHLCDKGYNDFFIDIGANIGLTSCQNGNRFQIVHMFEPNPYCCKILEVNSVIALDKANYKIHNIGLGTENKKTSLTVPRHNWGGAFIKDIHNSYDEKILASKDALQNLDDSNYFKVEIDIHDTADELKPIFEELANNKLTQGIIKIDVEGYELSILKGIAEAIPDTIKVFIIFESWNPNFDMDDILNTFSGRAIAYKLNRHLPWKKHWPKILKLLALLCKPQFTNRVEINRSKDWSGDLILEVN